MIGLVSPGGKGAMLMPGTRNAEVGAMARASCQLTRILDPTLESCCYNGRNESQARQGG